jgi:putative transposase
LRETARAFNAAASYCARVAWEQRISNKNKLHHVVYGPTRLNFGLGAQLACCARDKAAEAARATRANGSTSCPTFAPDGSIRYDARTYRLMSIDRVSLNTLSRRVTVPLVLGDYQRRALSDRTWKVGGAELVQRHGTWYLHISQTNSNPEPAQPIGYIGCDLGLVNLATTDDGTTFLGAQVQVMRKRRFEHRRRLQLRNTRRARWRLRQISRRESRFQKDVNHCISKALVRKAQTERKALALEDLTRLRERVTVQRSQRRVRYSWAFRQLRTFIMYKAALAGVRVVLVDPRATSRTCAVCGYCDKRNRPNQAQFRCLHCGHVAQADVNAATNISRVAGSQTANCAGSMVLAAEHKPLDSSRGI